MYTSRCLQLLFILTILPVFSANTMEQNATSNSNAKKKSITDTNAQQVTPAIRSTENQGLLGSASRYLWKKYTVEGTRAIIGLGDNTEAENTIAIYKTAKETTGKSSMPDVLKKQLFERQQLTQEFVLALIEKYNKPDFIPVDIKDGLKLCVLPEIDAVLTSDMQGKLKMKLKAVLESLRNEYSDMINKLDDKKIPNNSKDSDTTNSHSEEQEEETEE